MTTRFAADRDTAPRSAQEVFITASIRRYVCGYVAFCPNCLLHLPGPVRYMDQDLGQQRDGVGPHDVGPFNISAYNDGMMGTANSTTHLLRSGTRRADRSARLVTGTSLCSEMVS